MMRLNSKGYADSGSVRQTGQLMIEILVGVGILTMILVVSLTAITHATRLARAARNRQEAKTFALQVLESLRNERDLNKDAFFASESCDPACGAANGIFGTQIIYTCSTACTFTPAGAATRAEVVVTMAWDDGGNVVSVSIPSVLTKYDL